MIGLSLCKEKVNMDNIEKLLMYRNLYCGRLGTFKATYHTNDLENEIRPIHYQTGCSENLFREVLREHIEK